MRRQTGLAVVLWLAVAGCGGGQAHPGGSPNAPTGSPSSAVVPPVPLTLVIASLDAESTMSVRLVERNGQVAAMTQFTPPPQPALSNCADLLQPPVRVARGAVYFADSSGDVRRLAVDGTVSQVTTFKLTSKQQALSYAVSPDGNQLIAVVLSTPPLHNPPPQTIGDPVFGPGSWSLDLETATAGEPSKVAFHKDLGAAFPSPTVITGWDTAGPTATVSSELCTQAALPSWTYNGTLVRLGLDGTHLDQIGGSGCQAWDELVDGTVLCGANDFQSFSVRRRNGDVLWSRSASPVSDVTLSPDGNGVASGDGAIYLRDTQQRIDIFQSAQQGSRILGWADAGDVVTLDKSGRLGLTSTANPQSIADLGLMLSSPCLSCVPYEVRLIGTLGSA